MFEYILFAHNNIETRNIFYEALTGRGYKVTTAPTHSDLWKILEKIRPDYIILDPEISDIPAEMIHAKIKGIDENIKVIILQPEENTPQAIIKNTLKLLTENSVFTPGQKTGARAIQFKANILVVEDEKDSAELVKNYLSRRGFIVDIAFSGEEAMLKINTRRPDIVLLDIYMAGVDGLIVLKAIKETDKDIIVIMTTAAEDNKIVKEAMRLGANGYLVKPFNLENLEKTIIDNAIKK